MGSFQAVKARREIRLKKQIYCMPFTKGSIRVGFEKLSWYCHRKKANVWTGKAILECRCHGTNTKKPEI